MKEELINKAYEIAKERYAAVGVDTEKVMETMQNFHLSLHCWQAGGLKNDETRNGEQPVIYEQAVHRFILLQADITCIGLLDLGIYRFE